MGPSKRILNYQDTDGLRRPLLVCQIKGGLQENSDGYGNLVLWQVTRRQNHHQSLLNITLLYSCTTYTSFPVPYSKSFFIRWKL